MKYKVCQQNAAWERILGGSAVMNIQVCFEISFPLSIVNPPRELGSGCFLIHEKIFPLLFCLPCWEDGAYKELQFREGCWCKIHQSKSTTVKGERSKLSGPAQGGPQTQRVRWPGILGSREAHLWALLIAGIVASSEKSSWLMETLLLKTKSPWLDVLVGLTPGSYT